MQITTVFQINYKKKHLIFTLHAYRVNVCMRVHARASFNPINIDYKNWNLK